eukprot:GILJ01013374.1.p1 GENE.GILJ01013374.1~~GILJ01013374.1.p1  ORF type:complete len:1064 (-),score=167.66 GILJ01013374.1:51-3242(-)
MKTRLKTKQEDTGKDFVALGRLGFKDDMHLSVDAIMEDLKMASQFAREETDEADSAASASSRFSKKKSAGKKETILKDKRKLSSSKKRPFSSDEDDDTGFYRSPPSDHGVVSEAEDPESEPPSPRTFAKKKPRLSETEGAEALLGLASIAADVLETGKKKRPTRKDEQRNIKKEYDEDIKAERKRPVKTDKELTEKKKSKSDKVRDKKTLYSFKDENAGFNVLELANSSNRGGRAFESTTIGQGPGSNFQPSRGQPNTPLLPPIFPGSFANPSAATGSFKPGAGRAAPAPIHSDQIARPLKRCATHVAIAYHIFFQQRSKQLQQQQGAPGAPQGFPQPHKMALDPTLGARRLKEQSEWQKMHKRPPAEMSAFPFGFPNRGASKEGSSSAASSTSTLPTPLQTPFGQTANLSQLAFLQHPNAAAAMAAAAQMPYQLSQMNSLPQMQQMAPYFNMPHNFQSLQHAQVRAAQEAQVARASQDIKNSAATSSSQQQAGQAFLPPWQSANPGMVTEMFRNLQQQQAQAAQARFAGDPTRLGQALSNAQSAGQSAGQSGLSATLSSVMPALSASILGGPAMSHSVLSNGGGSAGNPGNLPLSAGNNFASIIGPSSSSPTGTQNSLIPGLNSSLLGKDGLMAGVTPPPSFHPGVTLSGAAGHKQTGPPPSRSSSFPPSTGVNVPVLPAGIGAQPPATTKQSGKRSKKNLPVAPPGTSSAGSATLPTPASVHGPGAGGINSARRAQSETHANLPQPPPSHPRPPPVLPQEPQRHVPIAPPGEKSHQASNPPHNPPPSKSTKNIGPVFPARAPTFPPASSAGESATTPPAKDQGKNPPPLRFNPPPLPAGEEKAGPAVRGPPPSRLAPFLPTPPRDTAATSAEPKASPLFPAPPPLFPPSSSSSLPLNAGLTLPSILSVAPVLSASLPAPVLSAAPPATTAAVANGNGNGTPLQTSSPNPTSIPPSPPPAPTPAANPAPVHLPSSIPAAASPTAASSPPATAVATAVTPPANNFTAQAAPFSTSASQPPASTTQSAFPVKAPSVSSISPSVAPSLASNNMPVNNVEAAQPSH